MNQGQDWLTERAEVLIVRENVLDILTKYAIPLVEILGRQDYTAMLRNGVLNIMERGDYKRALDNLCDFALEDPVLDKLLTQLIDNAEPGLAMLAQLAREYRLDD